ncbi:MAG: amino acid permease [Planctomycetia bacterium]|nr:amino acid permease [Planctomycetia bacterium]
MDSAEPRSAPAPLPVSLPRVLGPFDACMVVVGSVIGSGVFLKPATIATALPYFGPIIGVWIVVGLVTLCGCLALAELGAMLPQSGGPYVYLREAYGRLPAFLWGWTEFWIIRTGSIAALSTGTAININVLCNGRLDHYGQLAVTLAIVCFLSAINYVSTRWSAHVQNLTSIAKVAFLAAIIILPFCFGKTNVDNLQPIWPERTDATLWSGFAAAMIAVLWAYDGWINIGPITEEIRNPQRNVPLALLSGMLLVMFVYVTVNCAFHLVLNMPTVAASSSVAASTFSVLAGGAAAKIVAFGVMCSTFGAANSNMLTGPRIYFAMARDGLLPHVVQRIHGRFETPANAILVQCIWTSLLTTYVFLQKGDPLKTFDDLTNFVIFGGSFFYALAVGAVFVLRYKKPELPRPYRTWGYPFTPALYLTAFAAALVSLLMGAPEESARGSLLIAAGVPVYFYMLRGSAARSARL